jgi:chromosome segregation ATPase
VYATARIRAAVAESELRVLRHRESLLTGLEAEAAEARAGCESAEARVAAAEQEISGLRSTRDSLAEALEASRAETAAQGKTIRAAEARLRQLEAEAETHRSTETQLRERVRDLDSEAARTARAVDSERSRATAGERAATEAGSSLAAANRLIEDLRAEVDRLRAESAAWKHEHDTTAADAARLEAEARRTEGYVTTRGGGGESLSCWNRNKSRCTFFFFFLSFCPFRYEFC